MEERRQDYPNLLLEIEVIRSTLKKIETIPVELARLTTKVDERTNALNDWKIDVERKITTINSNCDNKQKSKLSVWLAVLGIIIVGLITWGEIRNQVKIDGENIKRIEDIIFKK